MKITVIGASAGVGLSVVRRALVRGHEVATLSRRLETLPEHAKLTRIRGSSTNAQDVRQAVQGAEVILVTLGTGDSWDHNSCLMKLMFHLLLKPVYADKSAMERHISTGYPAWEMVRPGRLTNGPETGRYRVQTSLLPGMRVGAISRADVAHFMLTEAENPSHLGQYPALSY